MILRLDPKFEAHLQGVFGKYNFQVGILEDKPHKEPARGAKGLKGKDVLGSYAGGPVRRTSNRASGSNVSDVSAANRDRLGFNYLTEPFEKRNSDIVRFMKEFFKVAFRGTEKKRAENLLQAVVRNPILRGDYGGNSALTQKIKGFDRGMIDTAQLFKSIKAFCKVRSNV